MTLSTAWFPVINGQTIQLETIHRMRQACELRMIYLGIGLFVLEHLGDINLI